MQSPLLLLIAPLFAAISVDSARAAFVNITIQNENALFENHPNTNVRNAWNALGGSLDVFRIYANFNSNTTSDHVNNVFGSQAMPAFLTSSNGSFSNFISINPKTGQPQHFDSPVSATQYNSDPAFAWDTFVTIGFDSNNWQTGFFTPHSGAALNHLQTDWVNTSVMWEPGPGTSQHGNAVAGGPSGFRVGLFQATVAHGVQVSGQFALDTGFGTYWC